MRTSHRLAAALCITAIAVAAGHAQSNQLAVTPAGADVQQVWHLGRVTGDLERIVRFYQRIGLGVRGSLEQALRFASNPTINEFVGVAPAGEYRAAFLPIPGASAETNPQNQIYLEAFEWRNVDRRQQMPALSTTGVSSLRFLVRDLDAVAAAMKTAGASVITAGAVPVDVPAPLGLSGSARALMVRDPDGYPVELMQVTPAPSTPAPAEAALLGAQMSVVVADLDASVTFYRTLMGADLQVRQGDGWTTSAAMARLRNLSDTPYRVAAVSLPGSTIALELIQYRGTSSPPFQPAFQDIGFGHVALVVRDIDVALRRLTQLGSKTLAQSGTWTRFNANLRGLYTRDRDGFFLEVIERR